MDHPNMVITDPTPTRWKCWVSSKMHPSMGLPGCYGCNHSGPRHDVSCRNRMKEMEPDRHAQAAIDVRETNKRVAAMRIDK